MIRGMKSRKKITRHEFVSVELIPVKNWLHDMNNGSGNFICIIFLEDGKAHEFVDWPLFWDDEVGRPIESG